MLCSVCLSEDKRRGCWISGEKRAAKAFVRDLGRNTRNPTPVLCCLGQVVLQSSQYRFHSDKSAALLCTFYHLFSLVHSGSGFPVFFYFYFTENNVLWKEEKKLNFRGKKDESMKAMHINTLTSSELWNMRWSEHQGLKLLCFAASVSEQPATIEQSIHSKL